MATWQGTNNLHVELLARELNEARRELTEQANRDAERHDETQVIFLEWEMISERDRNVLRAMARHILDRYKVQERK